jgi:hypothetical protein
MSSISPRAVFELDSGRPMPRYFFHIEDGGRITDPTGEDFPDESAAREAAELVASQISSNNSGGDEWRITVTNEAGDTVAEVHAWRRTLH